MVLETSSSVPLCPCASVPLPSVGGRVAAAVNLGGGIINYLQGTCRLPMDVGSSSLSRLLYTFGERTTMYLARGEGKRRV